MNETGTEPLSRALDALADELESATGPVMIPRQSRGL